MGKKIAIKNSKPSTLSMSIAIDYKQPKESPINIYKSSTTVGYEKIVYD